MIKRTVEVSTDGAYIHVRDGWLVVKAGDAEAGSVPLEDLGLLILDGRCTISAPAFAAILEAGGVVLTCAVNHQPAGMLLPLHGHILHAQRLRLQTTASQPLRKRLWQAIIECKIHRQALLTERLTPGPSPHDVERGDAAATKIRDVAARVKSGDPSNAEALAARLTWAALAREVFGADFRRDPDGAPPNNLLNYGYAVLRATAARAIVAAGLHPALGIHHHNRENAFALADDLIEPYRPVIDAVVVECWRAGSRQLDREAKQRLLGPLGGEFSFRDTRSTLMVALQRTANSLVEAFEAKDATRLALPWT